MSEIATKFVDLVLKYDWGKVEELSDAEVEVLLAIVSIAGFQPTRVVPGKLVGHYLNEDRKPTGETYPINRRCPYKVISRDGDDHRHATGWLNQAVCLVIEGSIICRQESIRAIQCEIERSVPLEPIQLTAEGDLLREYPPSGGNFVDHSRDDHELILCVGIHDYCNSWMDRKRTTETHDVIVCRGCYLRVPFPNGVETYGDLRRELASKLVQVPT